MPEIEFVRGLLGSPQHAIDAIARVEALHFENFDARLIFDAITECLSDGETPTPDRVARRVRSRVPTFALDIEAEARVMTRTALTQLAGRVSGRGTKRQMAKAARQVAEHIESMVGNDEVSATELQATLHAAVAQAAATSRGPIRALGDVAAEVLDEAIERFEGRKETLVWDIGVSRIDRRICAAPGKVTILGADSGHGKTSFISWYVAQQLRQFVGLGCIYLPLADMSMQDMAGRRLAAVSGENSNDILLRAPRSAEAVAELRAALVRLQGSYGQRFLIGKPGKTMAEIEADLRRGCLMLRHRGLRPGTAVIDYAQVVKSTDKANRFERLANLAERAEGWSDELGIHVVITSQLNSEPGKAKPGEGRPPRVNDIWGGKEMEWFSDSMLILIRKGRKAAMPLKDFNGTDIPPSSPHYQPIPPALTAVYEVDLWGLKGRFGHDEHPAHLDYLAPIGVYEEPGTGRLKRWNAQSSAKHSSASVSGISKPPSKWGAP